MKNNLLRSVTIVMAFLVLLGSTGFAFIEHHCMMRGKSVQFVSDKKPESCKPKVVSSCCAKSKLLKEAKGTFFKKTGCCKENQKFEKLDVFSGQTQLFAKWLKTFQDGIFWKSYSCAFLLSEWILPDLAEATPHHSFSSRLHGKSMRCFIQSFLI
ncbi:hypothetical protein [Dyadobacter sediminis]|uniref:Uncharacterized protein n=1 Tax=Dyadobacter sediminis TaxID=1493691 RepID=A0A5R9KDT0_9BACT|nr:hypothetical protein [Dyadobacter sediminis]TLU94191.1 hypothetical protein FEM55_08000 [Dyadobacter sediminis]GGB93458.1 hypothetical protein GCM10011325_21070 [Dyadobacter sediminis]